MDKDLSEIERLKKENDYLRRTSEQSIAKILQMEGNAIMMRSELEQKRRGFSLMAELAVTLEQGSDYEEVFVSVSRRINAALNMQRTAILIPCIGSSFRVSVSQGYPMEERKELESCRIKITKEVRSAPVMVTGADSKEYMADLRKALHLPYFISAPVVLHNDVIAIFVTGRLSEQMPFLPRLGHSDFETVQTVSAYLAAMLTGHRLQEAEHLAHYDPLTHLPNLRRTKQELHQILTMAERGGYSAAIMFVDLDGFKVVNDTHGHAAGDKVLKILAERLQHCVRESDMVGRIGGDEFAVILSQISKPEDAGLVAGKIVERLAEPVNYKGKEFKLSASVGIALFPEHGKDWDSLVKAADDAMYGVKNKGKNAFGFVRSSTRDTP